MGSLSPEAQRLVREQRLGYVATTGPGGAPYVSPKGSLTVLDHDNLVFADVESPHTVQNLSVDPRVEINVVDPYARKGYRFRGTAEILHSGTSYWKVLEMYRDEGADVRRIRSVVVVHVEKVVALISPIYSTQLEEEEVRAMWEEYYSKRRQKTILDLIPPRDF